MDILGAIILSTTVPLSLHSDLCSNVNLSVKAALAGLVSISGTHYNFVPRSILYFSLLCKVTIYHTYVDLFH